VQLFSSYVLAFVIFWRKNIPAKGTLKMWTKLTPSEGLIARKKFELSATKRKRYYFVTDVLTLF